MAALAAEHNGASQDEDIDVNALDMFNEPKDFRPPTPPNTQAEFALNDGSSKRVIKLSLVGSHPLWGHLLWNAAQTLCDFLAEHADNLVKGRTVLELGAASGLPSIAASKVGAASVLSTDYPDPALMDNLTLNCEQNHLEGDAPIATQGYIWGKSADDLLGANGGRRFDLLLMSDLIFNHQAHDAMLQTMEMCLPKTQGETQLNVSSASSNALHVGPQALVFFTHHKPHLAHRDLDFFAAAEQRGWHCRKLREWRMKPMFENDRGSAEVRATVHAWQVYR